MEIIAIRTNNYPQLEVETNWPQHFTEATANWQGRLKKSRIRETKHLSTDADISTDTTVGWTKNTQKPKFLKKTEEIIQNAKTQKHLEICQN